MQELQIRESSKKRKGPRKAEIQMQEECGYNFVIGDGRTSEKIAALKALCVLFYSLGKDSYNKYAWETV